MFVRADLDGDGFVEMVQAPQMLPNLLFSMPGLEGTASAAEGKPRRGQHMTLPHIAVDCCGLDGESERSVEGSGRSICFYHIPT